MAPAQGWHAQIEKWSKFFFHFSPLLPSPYPSRSIPALMWSEPLDHLTHKPSMIVCKPSGGDYFLHLRRTESIWGFFVGEDDVSAFWFVFIFHNTTSLDAQFLFWFVLFPHNYYFFSSMSKSTFKKFIKNDKQS